MVENIFQKIKNRTTMQPSNSTSGCVVEKATCKTMYEIWPHFYFHTYMQKYIYKRDNMHIMLVYAEEKKETI